MNQTRRDEEGGGRRGKTEGAGEGQGRKKEGGRCGRRAAKEREETRRKPGDTEWESGRRQKRRDRKIAWKT